MKLSRSTLATLSFASLGAAANAAPSMIIQDGARHRHLFVAHEIEAEAYIIDSAANTQDRRAGVLMQIETSIKPQHRGTRLLQHACTTNPGFCSPYETCVCTDEYPLREELITGCYHCSKPDGASCQADDECLTGISSCNDNVCGPRPPPQCPSAVNDSGYSYCSRSSCECTENGYTETEVLSYQGDDCFHCAKPDGASCQDSHECMFGSICGDDDTCGPPPPPPVPQCPSAGTSTVDPDNGTWSMSGECMLADCECTTGEYTVMEDIRGDGCYHCSKPDGAPCVENDECLFGLSYCDSNLAECTPLAGGAGGGGGDHAANECPLLANGICTMDEDCVCTSAENPIKRSFEFPFNSPHAGLVCYGCSDTPYDP